MKKNITEVIDLKSLYGKHPHDWAIFFGNIAVDCLHKGAENVCIDDTQSDPDYPEWSLCYSREETSKEKADREESERLLREREKMDEIRRMLKEEELQKVDSEIKDLSDTLHKLHMKRKAMKFSK